MTPALFICPDTNDVVFIIDVCKNTCDTYYKKAIFIRNVDVNTWTHFAIVNSNNIIEVYMNGLLIKTVVLNSMVKNNTSTNICFGEISKPTSDTGFNGQRAYFQYSQHAYSQRDIEAVINNTKLSNIYNSKETPLASLKYNYTKFLQSISFSNIFKSDETCY